MNEVYDDPSTESVLIGIYIWAHMTISRLLLLMVSHIVGLTRLPPKEISSMQDIRHVTIVETPLFSDEALAGNKCFWGIYTV